MYIIIQCSYSLVLTSSLFRYSCLRFPNRFVQENLCYPLSKYVICSNRSKGDICSFPTNISVYSCFFRVYTLYGALNPVFLYSVQCTRNLPTENYYGDMAVHCAYVYICSNSLKNIIRFHFAYKIWNEQQRIRRRKMLDACHNIRHCLAVSFELGICITKVNAFLHIFLNSLQYNRHFLTLFSFHLLAKNNVQYYVQFTSTKSIEWWTSNMFKTLLSNSIYLI